MTTKIMKMFNQVIRRGSGASLNLFRYAAKSCDSQGVVTAMSYGASDEHPMSIRSASDGGSWNTRVWKYAAVLLCLLTLGAGNAWAHGTHYGKAVLNNATGNGTVYLSTSSSSNSGQTGTTGTAGAAGSTSYITWDCGGSSGNDSKTYYARGTANDGYYFAGYATSSTATSYTASTTGWSPTKASSTSSGSPTTSTIYGFFKPVTVTGAPDNVNINATDPSATYNDAAGTVVSFTTANSNKIGDFTTSESGDSRWVISAWTRASASSATFNYKFVGNGSYGTNNRTFTKTVTLTSKGDASSTKTCTLTAKYPNPRVVECDAEATDLTIYPTFKAADATQEAVEKTAVFDVVYADNANNFSAAFSGATGGGTWTVTGISVDQNNQKATVTYTFGGNKIVSTHTAVLTLTANNCQGWDDTSADGGASATVTLTAENTQEATNDASVTTTANVTTEYATFAEALAAANATSGCTLTLLRNVNLGTITATNNITKAMTIDLNGKELRAAVNASSVGILTITQAVAVTIKDSKTGGKIINEVNRNSEVRTIFVNKAGATLTLESGTLAVNNLRQYASAANADLGVTAASTSCSARVIHAIAGTTVNINGGRVEAYGTRSVYGILQASSAATNKAGTSVLNISGGEIYAEGPYSTMGVYAYGKVNLSGGTITAHVTTNMIDARYAADATQNKYNGYGYGIYLNVSASATATSCYGGIMNMTGGTINVTNDREYNGNYPNYGILFNAAAANVSSATAVAADGKSHGQIASATGSIDGGEINVTSGTQNSYGVYVLGSYNSYDNTNHVVQIKNCKITSKAYVSAYGVAAWGAINSTNGACYAGDVELTNCDVYAESLTTTTAAAVWVYATSATIFKDGTTANAATWGGEFAVAGKAVINSGKYEAKTKTSSAYAVGTSSRSKTTYDAETTVAANRKRGGNAEAYPILIIHGGTFKATSTTSTARGVSNGGYCTIDGGTFEAFATTTTAHGLYCLTGKITASGVKVSASATGTAYGALADVSVPSYSSVQTGFAMAGELELNNCDITATTRTSTEARGVFVNATNKLHNWTQFKADSTSGKWAATTTYLYYKNIFPCTIEGRDSVGIAIAGKATINGCDIKATAATTTAYGVYSTATSVPASADSVASPVVHIKNTKFTVKTDGTTTAYGMYAGGPTTIDGCDFTVQPKSTTAYGVYAYDKKTTITNTKFDVKGTNTVYGLYANAAIGSTTGWDYHGEFELGEGNDMTVAATGGDASHVLTLIAAKKNVATGRFMGDYANAASAHITGGSYKATATGKTCYVLNLTAEQVQNAVKAAPSCTIEDGKFWAKADGGTTGICSTNGVIGNILFKGGVYNVNTTLSKHIPEGLEEVPLASDRPEYTEGYRYEVDKAGMHGIDVCQIGSTKYKSLEEALQVVTSGQVIYMIANYTMATPGDYVLPANTTLLIPYKDGTGKGASTAIGNSAVTNSSATTPSLFRKLTFGNGVNLTCLGTIETSAEQKCNGQYGACAGMVSGAYGQIHLEEGSHISLEANSRLNCWGYITGKGTINVKKNATVLEDFQLGDWCGGTNASTLNNNTQKVFPITHYFYQNIECPITYRPGSKALGSSHIYASSTVAGQDAVALVGVSGSGALFLMDNNDESADTWVMKDYDETTDQCVWTMNSGATIGNLNINLKASYLSYNFTSANYDLPITTNMTIILNNGEMGLSQNTVFLPGSKLIVNKQGTLAINGINVVAYDVADWTGTTRYYASYSPTWGTTNPRKNIAVQSADFFLHGKVNIKSNGGLYTTASGANVHSTNEDAGEVIYTTAAQGNKTNHYYLQQGGTTRTNITIYPAKLKNTDGSYASSAGTTSGKTWTFKNDIWDAWSKDGCFFMNAQDEPHAKPAALVQLTSKTPDANHLHHDAATGTRNFVWDENCYWWEVVTTPTAEGYYRSLNADNNGDYNYYYYDNAAACWKIKKITVTWNVNGTNTNYSVGYGVKPEWLGATPTKASSSSNYVWRWDGWTKGSDATVIANNDLPIVTENTTFTAHFYEKYYEYNITFKNSDGTILESKNWIAGTTPSYDGTPTKNPTAAETFEFNGTWTPAIATVSGSATYVANYTSYPRAYTITFLNYDMSLLGTAEVVYNGTPSNATYLAAVAPMTEDPYKPDNSAYSFEFAGWRLQGADENGFAQVKGDQTYIAQYDQTTKKYKVSFVDDDGETVLHYLQLEYGQTPSYTWADPDDKQDVEWNYSFDHWDPAEFTAVEDAQTYTAVYNKTKREYTITWLNDDDSQIDQTSVPYGEVPTHADATKEPDENYAYAFNAWTPERVAVTGNATYKATFTAIPAVASVTASDGTNYYTNIEDAFTAAKAKSVATIKMLRDVELGDASLTYNVAKTCILDLNGHTISGTNKRLLEINNASAVFTITDNSENKLGQLSMNTSKTGGAAFCVLVDYGKLYFEAGTIYLYTTSTSNNAVGLRSNANGKFTMNGGTVHVVATQNNQIGYSTQALGKDTINGGTLIAESANGEAYAMYVTGTMTVNGGKYHVTGKTPAVAHNDASDPTKLFIKGGYYNISNNLSKCATAPYHVLPASLTEDELTYNYKVAEAYTVTFKDGNNTTIQSGFVEKNQTPEYTGATPTKTATAQYTYTFNNTWSPAIVSVTGDATYTAQFGSTINQYTLTVATNNAEWGTVDGGGLYDYNSAHTITATPKAGFKFVEWDDHNTNASRNVTVTADVTYTATFDYDIANYTVMHWQQNIDNDEYTEVVADRQTDLSGTIGTATAAEAKNYTGFTLKSPIAQQTIAQSGTVVNIYYDRITYTIIWDVKLSTVTESIIHEEETLRYGATPSYGEDPTYGPTESQVFAFSGWTPTPYAVDKDQTYNGSFKVSRRPYTITFVNDNGDELWHSDFGYGLTPSYGGSTPVSTHTGDGYAYTFKGWKPAIAVVNGEATYTAKYSRSAEAITVSTPETVTDTTSATTTTVENGGALTIEEAELQSTTIIVESGGQLNVEESGSIEADVFIIQATTEEQGTNPEALEEVQVSGELSETGSKNIGAIYYDLTRKHGTENFLARVWYAVAVPWAVEVPNYSNGGVFIKRGDEYIPQSLGATFDLLSYDGSCRATSGAGAYCWVYLEDEIDGGAEAVMVPGKLYMIYLTEETSTIRFKKKDGEAIHTNSLTVSAHDTENGNDANWNGIANPATYSAYMNVEVNGLVQKFVSGTQPRDGGRYLPLDLEDKQAVGQPFFVQVNPEAGDGTSVVVTRENPSLAPLRAQAAEEKDTRYAIGIAANGKLADRLYIQTAEEKEDRYVIGKDMSKMGVSSYVAQMWVERYDAKLCHNTVALTRNKANYPLGISAPQAGEYMIFAPSDIAQGDNIFLTLDGRVIWNLTMAPYYASLDKGTTTRYGLSLVRSNSPAIETGADEVQSGNAQCTKVIMDDHVYILRGEELYTITGQKAK